MQWVAGGAVAEAVIARNGEQIVLVTVPESARKAEPNLASTAIAELRFAGAPRKQLADERPAVATLRRRSRSGSC